VSDAKSQTLEIDLPNFPLASSVRSGKPETKDRAAGLRPTSPTMDEVEVATLVTAVLARRV
jgi:hypothetical protein